MKLQMVPVVAAILTIGQNVGHHDCTLTLEQRSYDRQLWCFVGKVSCVGAYTNITGSWIV